jgi:hypothetical protein
VIVVLARYRYRIEPDLVQCGLLARTFGCCRVVFNDALRAREDARAAGEKIGPTEVQRRVITTAKTTEQRAWLGEIASVALVQSVRDAHHAYANFVASITGRRRGRRVGDPRFKSRKETRQSFRLTRNGFAGRPVVPGEGRRGGGALVPRPARRAVLGDDHPGAGWALLRLVRGRRAGHAAAGGRAGSGD